MTECRVFDNAVTSSPTPDEQLFRALTDIAQAVRFKRLALGALHVPICELVAALKGIGLSPERVVVLVKGALARSGLLHDDGSAAEVRQAVTWCIEAYFDTPVRRGAA